MGIFDNIVLDEFTMLDEGKQADEYRERKKREKRDNDSRDFQKASYRRDMKKPSGDYDYYRHDKHRNAIADKDYKEKYGHAYMDDALSGDTKKMKKASDNMEKISRDAYYKSYESGHGHKSHVNDEKIKNIIDKDEKNDKSDWGDMSGPIRRMNAVDAYDRHMRKQDKRKSAKTESALILIAGYESEFAY